jgi:hypothetical protein
MTADFASSSAMVQLGGILKYTGIPLTLPRSVIVTSCRVVLHHKETCSFTYLYTPLSAELIFLPLVELNVVPQNCTPLYL